MAVSVIDQLKEEIKRSLISQTSPNVVIAMLSVPNKYDICSTNRLASDALKY